MTAKTYSFLPFVLFFLLPLFSSTLNAQDVVASKSIYFILDGSGSMWQKVNDEFKIEAARRVLKGLVNSLPEDSQLGLVAYGHRRKGDCGDIETLIPLSKVDKNSFFEKVDELNPTGKTPITAAIKETLAALKKADVAATIILISDGLETCDGKPCEAVKLAKDAGQKFVFNVIGFGLKDDDVSSLECAAQSGGGLYFDAQDAAQLSEAVDQAVKIEPEEFTAFLSVKATKNGELEDVGVKIFPEGEIKDIVSARTYSGSETNPRVIGLPVGTYDVEVRGLNFRGEVKQFFKKIEITEGDTAKIEADFTPGELAIKVTRNGILSDAVVRVYHSGVESSMDVARGRSYAHEKSNPIHFQLTPGVYDVYIGSVEISGKPEKWLRNIEVAGNEKVNTAYDFKSGTLVLGAHHNGEFIDAVVSVNYIDTGKEAGGGRTYTSDRSNPRTFELVPGMYKVTLRAIKKELGKKEVTIEIKENQKVEKWVEF